MRTIWGAALLTGVVFSFGCPQSSALDGGSGGGTAGGANGGGAGGGLAGGAGGSAGGTAGSGGGSDMLGPLTAKQLAAPLFQNSSSFYKTISLHPIEQRLFAFPPVTSSTLGFITTLRLVDGGSTLPDGGMQAFVEALPVAGTVTAGVVNAAAIDPADGALVAVLADKDSQHFQVCALSLAQGVATFKAYTSVGAPTTQSLAYSMFPVSAGSFVVQLGNGQYPLTLSGTTATWGTPVTPASSRYPQIVLADGAQPRVLGFAEDIYQPPPSTMRTEDPTIFERALPDGLWVAHPASGAVPPTLTEAQLSINPSWGAYDASGHRILAGVFHSYLDFGITLNAYGLWSFDLTTDTWLKLNDNVGQAPERTPPLVDSTHGQLVMELYAAGFSTLSLRAGSAGTASSVSLYDSPVILAPEAAAVLGDGRVVSTQRGQVYSLRVSAPVWKRISKAFLPDASLDNHSLSFDTQSGKLLLFGGSLNSVPSAKLYQVALDGSGFPEIVPGSGTTVARAAHTALAHQGVLYVAGGSGVTDVSAFNLTSSSWRKLGDLPEVRTHPALQVVANELWVIGGVSTAAVGGVASIVAFDLTSGAQRMVSVDDAWPPAHGNFWVSAPVGDGVVVIDSTNTVSTSSNQLWTLDPVAGGGAHWTNAPDPHVSNLALNQLVGAAGDRHTAYFVGGHLWQLGR